MNLPIIFKYQNDYICGMLLFEKVKIKIAEWLDSLVIQLVKLLKRKSPKNKFSGLLSR